jgi:hypothetical protein
MLTAAQKDLLLKIKLKTEQGKAIWKETSVDDNFVLDLKTSSISVTAIVGRLGRMLRFEVINPQGKNIEMFSIEQFASDEWDEFWPLFEMVRRKVLKVDETLRDISKELDSDDIVGEGEGRKFPDPSPF